MAESSKTSPTTDALNQSGAFLQIHVRSTLEQFRWSTELEHPVQSAPFVNDPLTHPAYYQGGRLHTSEVTPQRFVQASMEYQNKIELEETSIDVLGANANSGECIFKLCIECKNLNPDYSDWIFFKHTTAKTSMNLITKSHEGSSISLFKVPSTTQNATQIHVDLKKFTAWDPFKHIIADSSVAISNNKIDKITYQTRKNLVDNAARQIITGTYGFIIESIFHQVLTSEGFSDPPVVFVPIIVTSANLKICEVDAKTIDPKTGYTTTEPSYVSTDSIIYECASPKSVRFPHPSFSMLSAEHRKEVSKWHVLILTPKGFVDFLKDLKSTDLVR